MFDDGMPLERDQFVAETLAEKSPGRMVPKYLILWDHAAGRECEGAAPGAAPGSLSRRG